MQVGAWGGQPGSAAVGSQSCAAAQLARHIDVAAAAPIPPPPTMQQSMPVVQSAVAVQ
jgi:hypothetical protein